MRQGVLLKDALLWLPTPCIRLTEALPHFPMNCLFASHRYLAVSLQQFLKCQPNADSRVLNFWFWYVVTSNLSFLLDPWRKRKEINPVSALVTCGQAISTDNSEFIHTNNGWSNVTLKLSHWWFWRDQQFSHSPPLRGQCHTAIGSHPSPVLQTTCYFWAQSRFPSPLEAPKSVCGWG